MWAKVKLFFARLGFWVWVTPGGYYLWSKFWRWILEGKYKKQKLTQYAHFDQLVAALAYMKWTEDPLKGLFDVVSRPEKVEQIFQLARLQDQQPLIGDCDEFAIYAASRVQDLYNRNLVDFRPYFMTMNWFDSEGDFHGHNICALSKRDGTWGHMGNWFKGRPQWDFGSAHDIAMWFATKSSRDGRGQLIAWALATPDLVPFHSRVWNA